jgi:hypothetical protein
MLFYEIYWVVVHLIHAGRQSDVMKLVVTFHTQACLKMVYSIVLVFGLTRIPIRAYLKETCSKVQVYIHLPFKISPTRGCFIVIRF